MNVLKDTGDWKVVRDNCKVIFSYKESVIYSTLKDFSTEPINGRYLRDLETDRQVESYFFDLVKDRSI